MGKMEVLGGQLIDREISLECTIQLHHLYFIKHEIMFIIVLDNSVRDISSEAQTELKQLLIITLFFSFLMKSCS